MALSTLLPRLAGLGCTAAPHSGPPRKQRGKGEEERKGDEQERTGERRERGIKPARKPRALAAGKRAQPLTEAKKRGKA